MGNFYIPSFEDCDVVIVDKHVIDDRSLSLSAIGVYAYICSKTEDDNFNEILKNNEFVDGVDELVNAGYLSRTK